MNKLRFGANYVHSNKWFRDWAELDLTYTERDIAAIASLGLDHIRMHLMWDIFQPEKYRVCESAMKNLRASLDICHRHGIDVLVTVFDGYMSGFIFRPDWAESGRFMADADIIEGELWFLEQLAAAIGDHPALMGIDLGNELNMFAYGERFDSITVEEGDAWNNLLCDKCMSLFPGKVVVNGTDHSSWFFPSHAFTRPTLANTGTLTSLHTWIEFTQARRYGDESPHVMHLQDFMIEVARAYASDPARKVWVQEFGISDLWLAPERHENFLRTAMANAATCEGLFGFTYWCSHDLKREWTGFDQLDHGKPYFRPFHPLEYELGLLYNDNRVKERGLIIKSISEDLKKNYKPAKKETAIILDDKDYEGWKYGEKYVAMCEDGVLPQFVLRERTNDVDYLTKRGIKALVEI